MNEEQARKRAAELSNINGPQVVMRFPFSHTMGVSNEAAFRSNFASLQFDRIAYYKNGEECEWI